MRLVPRLPSRVFLVVIGSFVAFPNAAPAQFPFPISPDKPITGIADFSDLNSKPAGTDGFVRVDGEHFVTDAGPVRFWGVNLCFGTNFPEPADAEKLAAHLASLAVNAVRIHHHESQYTPAGLYDCETKKFDYLLAQLHKHGIYVNLNLHVGRNVSRELGLPPLGTGHSAGGDKHLLHFFPPVQEAFWQFCRDHLGHTNPHRKLRRADDPGVAMVEILNENRFHKDGPRHLAAAPEPYRSEILKQWNV